MEEKLKWYGKNGKGGDVVISSRVRLARNLNRYPFSTKLSGAQALRLLEEAGGCAERLGQELATPYYYCRFDTLSEVNKLAMVERHIVSPAFAVKKQADGLILSEDESAGIMINEEDHIRIQAISAGMAMGEVWERASRIDDITDEKLHYAYDKQYGYKTSCPTNVGTGMRASYMMFLPALTSTGRIPELSEEMAGYGITMRGIYGEGTQAVGAVYQVSNQRTLGYPEQEIIDNLDHIVHQVIRQERKRREMLLEKHFDELEDQVHRSYGVLKYATKISSSDAMTLLGQLKLGIDLGLIHMEEDFAYYRFVIAIQRANLQLALGKSCGNVQRDKYRAEFLRENLPEIVR